MFVFLRKKSDNVKHCHVNNSCYEYDDEHILYKYIFKQNHIKPCFHVFFTSTSDHVIKIKVDRIMTRLTNKTFTIILKYTLFC